jgi:hypothetical protein
VKVLFIAYQFPPLNVGGSFRPFYFVKYLKKYGVEPVVLTLAVEDYNKVYQDPKIDTSLSNNLSENIDIRYCPSNDLLSNRKSKVGEFLAIFFNIYRGSERDYWSKYFFNCVDEIIKEGDIKAIFVTAPPFGILPLALRISKIYNLPLITDFRDAWTYWISNPYSSYFNYLRTKFEEHKILKASNKIIVTSNQTIRDFQFLHPKVAGSKYHYIPNGFDQEIIYEDLKYTPGDKIKIGYVGSFYYSPEARTSILNPFWKKKGHRMLQYVPRKEDWLYRSPYFFFKAVRQLIDVCPELEKDIDIHFVGRTPDWLSPMISAFILDNVVHLTGFLSREESVQFQSSCDFLLLTSSKVLNGRDYSVAGKTFEYFQVKKPILAFVCEGEQKDLLIKSNAALIFDPDCTEENVQQLERVLKQGVRLKPNHEYINSFKREHLAQRLAGVIKEVVGS